MTPTTVQQSIDLCMDEVYSTRANHTARAYRGGLSTFLEYLRESGVRPDSPLEILSVEHFIRFPAWLAKMGYAKKTCGVKSAASKVLLDWLVVQDILNPTYSDTIRLQKATRELSRKRETRLPRTPGKGNVEKMLVAVRQTAIESPAKERNIAFVEFLASTGCRIDEAARLKVRDVDLIERRAKVVGKGTKERIVFFSSAAARALAHYWTIRGFREKSHPAFARHDDGVGKRISQISTVALRKVITETALLAGLEKGSFTPHSFRHAFATKMLRETGNLALVQDLLGHASPASTRVYAKIDADDLRQAHRKVWD